MGKKAKELIPPGLVYIADNITSRQNVLGAPKGTGARWAKDLNLPKEADLTERKAFLRSFIKRIEI